MKLRWAMRGSLPEAAPHALADIAIAAGGTAPAIERTFAGVAPLQSAGPDQVSFLDNRRYALGARTDHGRRRHRASGDARAGPGGTIRDRHNCDLRRLGARRRAVSSHAAATPGHSSSAVVDRDGAGGRVGGDRPLRRHRGGREIGPGCRIGPFVSIGQGVTIGRRLPDRRACQPEPRLLGSRVYVYPGARIGQEGFSFAATKTGFLSIPQLGRVIVEDDVEVGANTTIDRGSTRDTVIGAGSRLDNLVQIGHNVRLGRCCVIVAQVGIAGSTVLEDFVQVGGQAAMAGHLRIGQGAQIGAQAGSFRMRPQVRCCLEPRAATKGVLPPGRHSEAYYPKAEITCSVRKPADLSLSAIHAMLEHDKHFPSRDDPACSSQPSVQSKPRSTEYPCADRAEAHSGCPQQGGNATRPPQGDGLTFTRQARIAKSQASARPMHFVEEHPYLCSNGSGERIGSFNCSYDGDGERRIRRDGRTGETAGYGPISQGRPGGLSRAWRRQGRTCRLRGDSRASAQSDPHILCREPDEAANSFT